MGNSNWSSPGRAIDVLQATLPHFFSSGLVASIDKATGDPRPTMHIPIASANPLDVHSASPDDIETIYSSKIKLSYTPPVALPAPFPKVLHIEGLPLYMASSVFVRHTLNALYSDMQVALRRVSVQPSRSGTTTSTPGADGEPGSSVSPTKIREKSIFIGLTASGISRVSGTPGEWDVDSTYTFSPTTGLIHVHTVNSIHPAPHHAVYDALRLNLGKVFGLGLIGEGEVKGGAGVGASTAAYDRGSQEAK